MAAMSQLELPEAIFFNNNKKCSQLDLFQSTEKHFLLTVPLRFKDRFRLFSCAFFLLCSPPSRPLF